MIGTLYELLVAQSLLVKVGDTAIGGEAKDEFALFTSKSASKPEILQQYCDTDILLQHPGELILIQCKASSTPNTYPLTRVAVKQILVDAGKHLVRLRSAGTTDPVTSFILASNRPLHPDLAALTAECAAIDLAALAPSACPASLLEQGQDAATLLTDWCAALKDTTKNKSPVIDQDTADAVASLIPLFSFAELQLDTCIAHFKRSVQKMGLFESEITEVSNGLMGRLTQAMVDHTPIQTALRGQFFVPPTFHTFCPDEILSLHSAQLRRHWNQSDLDCSWEDHTSESLPREDTLRELESKLFAISDSADSRILVVVGDGGTGKTCLAFQVPSLVSTLNKQEPFSPVFGIVDGSTVPESILSHGLDPYFEHYRYPRIQGSMDNSSRRLEEAAEACNANIQIWILIPNSDELTGDKLPALIEQLQRTGFPNVKFVLTARSRPWGNLSRWSRGVETLVVGNLSRAELYKWFFDRGVSQSSGGTRTFLPVGGLNTLVRPSGGRDMIDSGWLDHALCFGAFREWIDSFESEIDRVRHLEGFLVGNAGSVQLYAGYSKAYLCKRIQKHCQRFDVDIGQITRTFENIWQRRDALGAVQAHQWQDELCLGQFSDPVAREVVQQFLQVGVLAWQDADCSRLRWSVPFANVAEVEEA